DAHEVLALARGDVDGRLHEAARVRAGRGEGGEEIRNGDPRLLLVVAGGDDSSVRVERTRAGGKDGATRCGDGRVLVRRLRIQRAARHERRLRPATPLSWRFPDDVREHRLERRARKRRGLTAADAS